MWLPVLASALVGYLLGSVPVGYVVGRVHGTDIRQHGSGRTGGTNVWRALGLGPAIVTVLGDALKGAVAVLLARYVLHTGEYGAALAGAMAVVGHNWSIFLGLRGGAGGMTAASALLALNPIAGLFTAPLAILGLYLSRFASVGTLTIGLGGLIILLLMREVAPWLTPIAHPVFASITAAAIVVALMPNIRRLLHGDERRITLW
ncbi:MAG: glycerol-3-phosphate acyltransferase [Anaerolineae bacterium]|nr:glycerol-3-phosphate acyltransferase [Anaerolineae bacterium]